MSRFTKAAALAAILASGCILPIRAQVEIQPEADPRPQHYSVTLNGVAVSGDSVLYLSEDGTLFASGPDLVAWKLRYKEEPAFIRNGKSYYGLQTQLKLAVSVQRPQEALKIIAPPSAFLGRPENVRAPVTSGGGAFLNYKLDYRGATSFQGAETTGEETFAFTRNASALNIDYGSLQTAGTLKFARQASTLSSIDYRNHRVFSIGEQSMDAGDLGINPEILGVHVASDYDVDPHFITTALPSVSGFAKEPSLVEVFVNNKLQWRQQVLEGPFTVRNLPPSAAHSDVTLVLTGPGGHRTTEVVRPNYEPGLAEAGVTQYTFDAGYLEREGSPFDLGPGNFGEPHVTQHFAISSLLRRGVTNWLTLQAMGESLGGETFGAAGVELRPFVGDANLWFGNGKLRRSGRISYYLSGEKFSFNERFEYNAEKLPDPFEPNLVRSSLREEADLQYSPTHDLRFDLKLDRNVTSDGSAQSLLTLIGNFQTGRLDFTLEPMYDRERHAIDLRVQLGQRINDTQRLSETANRPAAGSISGSIAFNRSPRDPDDRWRFGVRNAMGRSLTRSASVESQMPWSDAKLQAQDTVGIGGDVNGELEGAAGLIYGAGAKAMRDRYQENTLGVVRLAGFPGVQINVNDSPAGHTDGGGNLVVQYLSALQENLVAADLSSIPIGVDVKDPIAVVPLPATPVVIDMLAPQAQSVSLRLVDANGKALPQATWLIADDGTRFPIGFDGRAYIHGLRPGTHTFTAEKPQRCALQLTLQPRWEIVDAGTQSCR